MYNNTEIVCNFSVVHGTIVIIMIMSCIIVITDLYYRTALFLGLPSYKLIILRTVTIHKNHART